MLKICYLYPDILNQHGNWGNVAALLKRCVWRKIDVDLIKINPGDPVDFAKVDIVYLGTGSEQARKAVFDDLMPRRDILQTAIEQGMVMLAAGSGCHLLGMYRLTEEGHRVSSLGLISFYTRLTNTFLVGDCVIGMQLAGNEVRIAGFENHREHVVRSEGLAPLGNILYGHGNNGKDKTEGFRYKNVFGTNMASLLPKNPMLTDLLLGAALQNKKSPVKFTTLDNSLEERALDVMLKRLLD
ncbi:MAG: glutamine amidotransferase [Peptococcaceae bacterium]|jgi:CobQ-like glutamine amidotransferase family enzyme|nr:glutamine amidotransferase [Peptococcaceae bacterium]MDR2736064.1 glutamine amidotransferase [Gracilibacteraceae bacterium]